MHILYLHQYFATPKGSTGTRSYEFARRWIRAGHKVTVITGQADVSGLGVGKGIIQKQSIEGINIVVVGLKYSNKQTFARRMVAFFCFIIIGIYAGLRTKNIDVIYATSTPLTIGFPAIVLKWLKRIPFVFEVRDQWPEVPVEMGIIKNKLLIIILLWLERTIYKQSKAVVALSPGMAQGVETSLRNIVRPVAVIPNSSDTNVFRPDVDGSEIRRQLGWNDKFVLLHFGAMGKANGLDFVVDAAGGLKNNHQIHFVLIGDGSEKQRLKSKVKDMQLTNIEVLDSKPKEQLPGLVTACDVSMVIFANHPILEDNSANKFFDSLSAGKPVLLNYSGWQRNLLEKYHAGFGCNQCDLIEFIEKVLYLHSHRDELAEMGRNARRAAEKEFDRDNLAHKALDVIVSAKTKE